MGASPSKEELLYQEVQKGNHDAVKAFRRDGASLEWADKEGRTPLILACTRRELLDMSITLLNLGSSINAYRPGTHGGFPLHHAAKRGLEKTVTLLLSRGANPFAVNDDGHTPLEVARSRGHVSVVRLLEVNQSLPLKAPAMIFLQGQSTSVYPKLMETAVQNHDGDFLLAAFVFSSQDEVSIFSGMLRELSGPGILESFVPNLCTKKIWVVIIPIESPARRESKYELAIYTSPKISLWNGIRPSASHPAGLCNVAQPRTIIQLSKTEVEEPKFSLADPMLYIVDKSTKTRYKFLSEKEGDKAQLQRFHKACKGISQVQCGAITGSPTILALPSPVYLYGNPCQIHPVLPYQSEAPSPARKADLHYVIAASNVSSPSMSTVSMPDDLELALALDASIRSATEEGISFSPNASHPTSLTDYAWHDDPDGSYSRWSSSDPENWTKKICYGGWGEGEEGNSYQTWGPAEAGTSSRSHSTSHSSTDAQPDALKSRSTLTLDTHVVPPSAPPLPHVTTGDNGPINYLSVGTLVEMDSLSTSSDKMETEKVNGLCVVCWDAPAEGACIPCGHMASCMSCLSEINTKNWGCPVCRAPIQQIIKVYAV